MRKLQSENDAEMDDEPTELYNEPSEHLEGSVNQNVYGYTGNIPYDVDYFKREAMDDMYKECFVPGVTSAVCVPREVIKDETEFCYETNYPYVCVPLKHFLWPFWDVKEKDFLVE